MQGKGCGGARFEGRHGREQFGDVGNGFAIDAHDHVTGPHPRLGGRAILQHAGDDHARSGFHAKGFGQLGREFAGLHANPAARHLAVFHDTVEHQPGGGDRDGKANAHVAARARVDGCVDAQQVAMDIHQCASRVAGVDGCVGLDEILEGVDAQLAAPQCADDAAGYGLAHAKRVANGQHLIAHRKLVRVAQHDHGQFVEFDLEDRKVGVRVGADHGGAGTPAVGERDLNFVGAFDHMVVGEDVAIGADDHAAAQPGLGLAALVAKEELEPRIVAARVPHFLAGVDADHGRRRLAGSAAEAARCRLGQRGGGGLDQRNARARAHGAALEPVGLQCGNNEIGRNEHGDGLGKKQPEAFHGIGRLAKKGQYAALCMAGRHAGAIVLQACQRWGRGRARQ